MDWKRDYRVSDLFRRNEDEDAAARPAAADGSTKHTTSGEASKSEASVWKKEIKLSGLFRRKRAASPPKQQLALPAPGETLSEAPTSSAQPPTPNEPEPQAAASQADSEVAAMAETAQAPAAGPAAEPAGEAAPVEEPQPGQADESDDAPEGAVIAAAVAGTVAASPGDSEPSEPSTEQADMPEEASPEPPSTETPAPPAEGTSGERKERRFGRKRPKSPESGPSRREHQPGPTAGHLSARRPARAGQLPQVPLMKALNLLPQDIKLPKTTLRPKVAQLAVVGVAVLVAAGMAFFWWSENQRLDDRRGTLEDKETEIAALQAEAEAPAAEDGTALAGEALSRATALSGAIDARVGWDRLLRELSLTLPENVWFQSMATNNPNPAPQPGVEESVTAPLPVPVGPSTLTITGYAMTQDDVAQLLARLGVVPEFSAVQLESAVREPIAEQNVITFTVIATMKPLPGGTP